MDLRRIPAPVFWAILLAGCAAGPPPTPSTPPSSVQSAPAPTSATVPSPPRWRVGDRWVYEWVSGGQVSTKTVEVAGVESVNGVTYYVAGVGEIQEYLTLELHWAASLRNSKVQARMLPPQPWYVWPLEAGQRWTHRAAFEDAQGRREQIHRFVVVGAETVEVPAGRFQSLKVMREADGEESDQYWYAPVVGSYVRWLGTRGKQQFEERLKEFVFAARPRDAFSPSIRSSLR
jgi:hypothetical protein